MILYCLDIDHINKLKSIYEVGPFLQEYNNIYKEIFNNNNKIIMVFHDVLHWIYKKDIDIYKKLILLLNIINNLVNINKINEDYAEILVNELFDIFIEEMEKENTSEENPTCIPNLKYLLRTILYIILDIKIHIVYNNDIPIDILQTITKIKKSIKEYWEEVDYFNLTIKIHTIYLSQEMKYDNKYYLVNKDTVNTYISSMNIRSLFISYNINPIICDINVIKDNIKNSQSKNNNEYINNIYKLVEDGFQKENPINNIVLLDNYILSPIVHTILNLIYLCNSLNISNIIHEYFINLCNLYNMINTKIMKNEYYNTIKKSIIKNNIISDNELWHLWSKVYILELKIYNELIINNNIWTIIWTII